MKKRDLVVVILLFVLLLSAGCAHPSAEKESAGEKQEIALTISAAASLKDAMDIIAQAYQDKHPEVALKFNFGGSGSLQQQISQGAPVDLFFSAAEDKFRVLVEQGAIAPEDGRALLGNSLVLVVPKDHATVEDFFDLAATKVERISIGTPETVPAGTYAKEALQSLGLWSKLEAKVVYAKDVRQVLSYVETGNVEAGIVYKTDALASDKVKIAAEAAPATHSPISYPVGIIKASKNYEAAKEFYQYLQSDEAVKVFEEYGFTIK